MQPPAGVQGVPCEERRKGEQEREKMRSQSEKVNVSTWSLSKCQSARKRERLVKRTELEDEMKLWSGQRIITGFNKTWISKKLKVLGGKKRPHIQSVSQSLADTQTVAPQSVPGLDQDTLPPPLREGPHMTRTGPANPQPPLTFADSSPFSLFSQPFFCCSVFRLILYYYFFSSLSFVFEFLEPDGTLGSKEVWVVIV